MHHTDSSPGQKHIVVIGGGFGGLSFLKALRHDNARITLIDQRNHHLFQPLLYQVATTGLAAPDIAQPLRAILSNRQDISVLMERVQGIDLEQRTVQTNRQRMHYDYLVIAAGGSTSYFGNDHWEKYASGLKSLSDARLIRNQVLTSLEEGESGGHTPEELEKLLTILIIGGGPTGVEMAGALAELTKKMLPDDFGHIDPRKTRIILAEGDDRILVQYPEELSRSAQRQLEGLGVELRLGQMVKDIRHQEAELANGEVIRAANICWTAGIGANKLTETLDLPKDKAGRLKVEPDCSLPGHPEAFAIGDIIHLVDGEDKPVPGVAQGAMQTGKYVAGLIKTELDGGDRGTKGAFVYNNRGEMATIGRHRAVAKIGKHHFSGFIAWMMWLVIHLVTLVGLRNRISVFLDWISAYLWFEPGARIIWELDEKETRESSD